MEDEDEFEENEYANEMYWMMRQPDIEWPMVSVNCWTASTMATITHFQVLNTKTESNRFSHCGSMWQIRRGERIVAIIVRNPDKSDANKTNEFSSFVSFSEMYLIRSFILHLILHYLPLFSRHASHVRCAHTSNSGGAGRQHTRSLKQNNTFSFYLFRVQSHSKYYDRCRNA